jgi:CPA1 family monovalent cation:H+ antiporter
VLAVVTTGIYISRQMPRAFTADTRMRQMAVWESLVFLLNGAVFILIGLQLPDVVRSLTADSSIAQLIGFAAVISATAILVRLAWVFVASRLGERLPFFRHAAARRESAGTLFVIGWAGMRGIVSLAAALALPLDFPGRDKVIFITFCVILATLVLQGLTLPLAIKFARFTDDTDGAREERQARLDATHAALSRLNVMEMEEEIDPIVLARIKVDYEQRLRSLGGTMRDAIDPSLLEPLRLSNRIRTEMLTAERSMVTMLRDQNVIGDDVLRRVLREIDLEAAKLA